MLGRDRDRSEKERWLVVGMSVGWLVGWARKTTTPTAHSTAQHTTHTAKTPQYTSSLRPLGYGKGPLQGSSTAKVRRDGQAKERRFGLKPGAVQWSTALYNTSYSVRLLYKMHIATTAPSQGSSITVTLLLYVRMYECGVTHLQSPVFLLLGSPSRSLFLMML